MKYLSLLAAGGVLTALLTTNDGVAQGNDLYFRQPQISARAVAVGEAMVADAHSVGSALWNPASLAYLESISFDVPVAARVDHRAAQGALLVPVAVNEHYAVAVGGNTVLFDPADWQTKSGSLYGGTVSGAVRLTQTLSVGALYAAQSAMYGGATVTSQNVGIGMMYTALPALSYGASFTGIGSGITYHQSDTLRSIELERSTPRSISLGAVWHFPVTHDRIVFNYFLSGQKIIGVDQVIYRMGIEIFPWKFLVVRGGVVSGPVTSVGRFGFGIRTPFAEIDYAMSPSVAEARVHTLTVSVPMFTR
jgi:hypothetical protein